MTAGETSQSRNLAFNDQNGEPFSVTFRALSGPEPEAGTSGSSAGEAPVETLIRLTINPLLGTINVDLL